MPPLWQMRLLTGRTIVTWDQVHNSLFVFLRDDPQQIGVKLLTSVSDLVFDALSDGTFHFALYGSSLGHAVIG